MSKAALSRWTSGLHSAASYYVMSGIVKHVYHDGITIIAFSPLVKQYTLVLL